MWARNVLPIGLCLQTVAAIPFVTNAGTGVSYQGTSADGIEQFQSIFYAEDTSGANRFAPPIPYTPERGSTVQATTGGLPCPQSLAGSADYPFDTPIRNISEDCLSLRIARPANQSSEKPLPVMVWIYGGGWVFGKTYDRIYNPVGLIQESVASGHPVMYVGINYRVGFFGFAASQTLQDAKSENIGLRDQRAALQWVKDNIAAFGGDPDNILLFGQSAGSFNTALQTVAFGGKQGAVFKKAIMDSGALITDFSTAGPFKFSASVAQSVNCSRFDPNAELACLRGLPLSTLLPAILAQAAAIAPPYGTGVIHPIVDGDFIPDLPSRLLHEGSFVKGISVINSWMEDDGSQFVPSSIKSEAAVVAFFSSMFSNSTRDKLLSFYPVEEFQAQVTRNDTETAQYYRASRIMRDYLFSCPALNFTHEVSLQSTNQAYVFTLNSTRFQPIWDSVNHPEWRIAHTSDIPYVFNEEVAGADNSKAALQLSAEVSRSFSAFATYGDPRTPVFDWPAAWKGQSGRNANVFVIGGPYGSGLVTLGSPYGAVDSTSAQNSSANEQRSAALAQDKLVERCAFLDSISS